MAQVVWESIGDVEGGNGSFVNSEFHRAATAGGDFAGLSAEQAGRDEWSTADGAECVVPTLECDGSGRSVSG